VTSGSLARIVALWCASAVAHADGAAPQAPLPTELVECMAERDAARVELQLLRARIRGLELSARTVEREDCSAASALACAACVAAMGAGAVLGGGL
jgi:hypothetical protein